MLVKENKPKQFYHSEGKNRLLMLAQSYTNWKLTIDNEVSPFSSVGSRRYIYFYQRHALYATVIKAIEQSAVICEKAISINPYRPILDYKESPDSGLSIQKTLSFSPLCERWKGKGQWFSMGAFNWLDVINWHGENLLIEMYGPACWFIVS